MTSRRRICRCALVVSSTIALSTACVGGSSNNVSGTIYELGGFGSASHEVTQVPVPAEVYATAVDTNETFASATNEQGEYVLHLPSGTYKIYAVLQNSGYAFLRTNDENDFIIEDQSGELLVDVDKALNDVNLYAINPG